MEQTDEALVQQAVTLGDMAAFEVLVRRHQARILALQKRFSRDHALAEDLAQETFLRAWRKLSTFSNTGSFGAWLAKLAYHIFLQHRRRASTTREMTSPTESLDVADTPVSGVSDELPDLQRMLDILEHDEQLVLVLNYAHGLSNSEIGDVLNLPTGTVKSQIHRAKEKIRQQFRIGQPINTPAALGGSPR